MSRPLTDKMRQEANSSVVDLMGHILDDHNVAILSKTNKREFFWGNLDEDNVTRCQIVLDEPVTLDSRIYDKFIVDVIFLEDDTLFDIQCEQWV